MKFYYENKEQIEFVKRIHLTAPLCMHHAVEFFYVKTGSLKVSVDTNEYQLHEGDIITIFPDIIHSYYDCKGESGYLLIIPVDLLKSYTSLFSEKKPKNPVITAETLSKTDVPELFEIFYKNINSNNIPFKIAFAQAIAGKLFENYSYEKASVRYNDRIREVVMYIHEHYAENPSRKTIARALGMNENYVSKILSTRLHTSLVQYVRSVQIQNAAYLLRNSDLSIKEIAEKSGFNSLRSFNRNFLNKFEVSPRNYRTYAKDITNIDEE